MQQHSRDEPSVLNVRRFNVYTLVTSDEGSIRTDPEMSNEMVRFKIFVIFRQLSSDPFLHLRGQKLEK